jgi:peptidoglycan DL-endopeptidase CwlO
MPGRFLGVPLVALVAALVAGCASGGGRPRPFPTPGERAPSAAPAAPRAPGVIRTALDLVGTPYRNGGTDPSGFDCSGYIAYVFASEGVTLPRTVEDLYRATVPVDEASARPGDLVFFTTVTRGPSHVGLALGDGTFVHAPSSRGVVRVERLDARYWRQRFLGARRVP